MLWSLFRKRFCFAKKYWKSPKSLESSSLPIFASIYLKSRRATQIPSTVSCSVQKNLRNMALRREKSDFTSNSDYYPIYPYTLHVTYTILKFHENSIRFQSIQVNSFFFRFCSFFWDFGRIFTFRYWRDLIVSHVHVLPHIPCFV